MDSLNGDAILGEIFENKIFEKFETKSLIDKYNISKSIYAINSDIRSQTGQLVNNSTLITEIPSIGMIIDKPGTYTFGQDILWMPGAFACSAITIAASDVILDLEGFSLTAIIKDNSQKIAGISIVNNCSNVTIQNATLKNMCFYGIFAENITDLTIKHTQISGLNFDNLQERLLSPAGIHIQQAKNITLDNCIVKNMKVNSDASAGIQILNTTTGNVSNCQLSNFINTDGSVQGFSYLCSSNINTQNCSSENFQSQFHGNVKTPGHTVLGFIPIFCSNLKFENCTADTMIGCCDDCHGMSVFLDIGIEVSNFAAKNIFDGVVETETGAKATGLEVYGVSVLVNHSTVENILAINPQDKQATGFSSWGDSISYTSCTAKNIAVVDQFGLKNPELGYGTGFGWAPDPRPIFKDVCANDVVYTDCIVENCQVGFDTWNHTDSSWKNPEFTNCTINILDQPKGFRILSGNPCSECIPPIVVTLQNKASGNVFPNP